MSEKTFCELLDEAIEDEAKAKEFYEKMLREVVSLPPRDRIIVSILTGRVWKAEVGHKETFEMMKRAVCEGGEWPVT